jgi:hypothetical protein
MMADMSGTNSSPQPALASRFTDEQRLRGVRWVIGAGFLGGFAFAPRVWISTRAYPVTPILPLPTVPFPLDYIGFGLLIVLLLLGCTISRWRWPWLSFVGLLTFLVLCDLVRLQPWVYLYGFLAMVIGLCGDAGISLNICRVVVVGTYFWSGMHKLNWTFLHQIMPGLLSGIMPMERALEWGPYLAWPALVLELGSAIGLLVGRVRNIAVGLLISMHLVILYLLGPFALDANSVIWPWNVAMSWLLLVLFGQTPAISWRDIVLPGRSVLHGVAIVLFAVLPWLHRFDLWDLYLSSSLYSGMHSTGRIGMTNEVAEKMPGEIRAYLVPDGPYQALDLYTYTMGELNVPYYPEPRFYRAMARRFCAMASDPDDVILLIIEPPSVWTGLSRMTYLRCQELE